MPISPAFAAPIIIALVVAMSSPARADNRAALNACQALIDRAAQSAQATAAAGVKTDDAELQRCQQIIREWAMRDARMSVDEHGQPLR
jgi:hypothetical protein